MHAIPKTTNGVMDKMLIIVGILIITAVNSGAQPETLLAIEQENSVALFKSDTVGQLTQLNRVLLIMCYVPWDRKYKSKIADYETVAKIVLKHTTDVQLVKLDVAAEPDLANRLEIKSQDLQFLMFYKGRGYNVAEFSDVTSLSKKVQTISDPKWAPPEVPALINRVKKLERGDLEKLNKIPFAIVMFYRETSPAAERLLYDFENAVHNLKDVPKPFRFYKFDATNAPNTMAKFKVSFLPEFKIFRHGQSYDWNGPYIRAKAISAYITEHMLPPLHEIPNPVELEKFLKNNSDRATVVGFFQSTTLAKFPLFVEAAHQLRDKYAFVLMSTPMVSNNGGEPEQAPGWTLAVILPKRDHTPDDERKAVLQHEAASFEMIVDFIKWKATPLAGERKQENEKSVYSLRPLVVVYGKVDWSKAGKKDTEYLRDKVASAAKENKDTLFAIADSSKYAHEMERFGFDMDKKYDLHVGIFGKDGEYYPRWATTHMNSKMISEFVQQFKAGEIQPFYRSKEPTGKINSEVTPLTGSTLQSEILKGSAYSYAVILFYHPSAYNWRLAEHSLSTFTKDEKFKAKNVHFYQMDISENDAPAYFNLTTYPRICMLHVEDKKNVIHYENVVFDQINLRNVLKAMIKQLKRTVQIKNTEL